MPLQKCNDEDDTYGSILCTLSHFSSFIIEKQTIFQGNKYRTKNCTFFSKIKDNERKHLILKAVLIVRLSVVGWLVGWFIGRSICNNFQRGRKLHFHAPFCALFVCLHHVLLDLIYILLRMQIMQTCDKDCRDKKKIRCEEGQAIVFNWHFL